MSSRNPGYIFRIKNTEPPEFALLVHSEQRKEFAEKHKGLVWIFLDQELTKPKYDKAMLKSTDLLEFIGYQD